ncbi:MAG: hypothetical protein HQL78_04860 [Magnetococcales bacterium]|nr:hypothetical protein [Magnetococcales bacterium]
MRFQYETNPLKNAWHCLMILVIPILSSGCASTQAAYPAATAQPLVYPVVPVSMTPAPRVPDLHEAWNRCTEDDPGNSYCSTSYRKVENYAPNASIVTEGIYIHSDQNAGQNTMKNPVASLKASDSTKTKTPRPHARTHHKPTANLVAASYPTQSQASETKPSAPQVVIPCRSATMPCTDVDDSDTKQIQNNIQALRSSLRDWMRSQGD